jgi:hypothetical protein
VRILQVLAVAFLLGVVSFAGCLSAGEDLAPTSAAKVRKAVPVINLNASLLDAAQFAADERFGPDRPLTLQDIPGLLPKGLTNYNTTLAYVLNMSRYENIKAYQLGETFAGRAIFGLLLTDDGEFHADRPSIMFTCSQHGNEPSGSEACLIFIEYFTHGTDQLAQDVRAKLNILINPLANPDGKEGNRRGNYDQVDINRDHMNLATPEGRAIHEFYNLFNPIIGLDLHEFGGAGTSAANLPAVTTQQTFQIAGPEGALEDDNGLFASTNELLRHVLQRSSEKFKFGSTGYYTGSTSVGASPSVHRHHFALRSSYSLLFETGGGAGVTNLPLRVDHHVTASFAVIEWFFANQAKAIQTSKDADASAMRRAPGIQGWVIPPQKDTEKAKHFLGMHGLNVTVLEKDTSFQVQDYKAGAAPTVQSKSFTNGTLMVSRWQPDGRLAEAVFENTNTEDTYYTKGPRAWPLEAYRIIATS